MDARKIRWERVRRLAREAGECAVVASGSERPGNRSLSIGREETGGGVVGAAIGMVSHTATRHVGGVAQRLGATRATQKETGGDTRET